MIPSGCSHINIKIIGFKSSICTGTCASRQNICSIKRDGDGDEDCDESIEEEVGFQRHTGIRHTVQDCLVYG